MNSVVNVSCLPVEFRRSMYYKHNAYKNLIKNISAEENKISKFSLLEINKSRFNLNKF